MARKGSEKIIDALTQLMEGFNELREKAEADYSVDDEEEGTAEDSEISSEIDAAIVTEMRAALEAVIDAEDVTPEEIAAAISSLTEALEEIDPDVFEVSEDDNSMEGDNIYRSDDDDYYDESDDLDEDFDADLDEDEDEKDD